MQILKLITLMVALALPLLAQAEEDRFAKVKIEREKIADGIYMLKGAGGNIGVSAGEDGILIIDDQFAPLAPKIEAALADLSPRPVKYVVNTHVHGDHIGGNKHFGKTATIFAHHNVLQRMSDDPEQPREALPVVTYGEGVRFHFNQMTLMVQHLPDGHTDGDSVVWFKEANVVHMGDLLFNGMFPFIDLERGGTVAGYTKNMKTLYAQMDEDVRLIAGHGPIGSRADLARSIEMLERSIEWMIQQKNEGLSLAQIKQQGLPEKLQGWAWRFITAEFWIETLYNGLQ